MHKREFNKAECKPVIIIQARMSSGRFPGKMMSRLSNMPLIEYVYKRCRMSSVKDILVATSEDKSDDLLYRHCSENSIPVFRGSLSNVLKRYIQAAGSACAKYVVRVCGDTPLVDTSLIDRLLSLLIDEKLDYVSMDRKTCAAGFYSEAVTLQALKEAAIFSSEKEDIEHVTRYVINHPERFKIKFIAQDLNPDFVQDIRLTIDYPEDLELVNFIVENLENKFSFTSLEVLEFVRRKGGRYAGI